MKKKYKSEIEAMRDFYDELDIIPDYSCNTDGRVDGTLVEFKLTSDGIPRKQLKRYLKSYNSCALSIPRYSLFININQREFTFLDNENDLKIIINGKWKTPQDLLKFLDKKNYIKGWIDEFSIVAYNDLFYNKHLSAKKEDFIEEIKNPKELNIEPYQWDKTGDMERSILDCLGSSALKKRLGAFFTPDRYVNISTQYLRNAIARVPKGWDYIILDRCAGTGNLLKFLTSGELSHCILNTYVYAEWTTLKGLYDDRVRYIIPHTKDYKDPDGLLSDGNALTEEFHNTIMDIIEKERKKANGKLVVIGLENPPYSTPGAEATRSGKTHKQKPSWVKEQMKLAKVIKGDTGSDLCNHFIYSATNLIGVDEYIIYAPIKYWKSQHLFDGKFNEGYICNRKYFHATDGGITLISWGVDKCNNTQLKVSSDIGTVIIKKSNNGASSLLPSPKNRRVKNKFAGITLHNGTPAYINGHLTNVITEHDEGRVRELNITNAKELIPFWVANSYNPKDYTEKDIIFKSGDGGTKYCTDADFLDDCFVWACLTSKNKCISNKQLKNELCFNQNTEADKLLNVNTRNTKLLQKWNDILVFVKKTKEYKSKLNYGLRQISQDINITIPTGSYDKKNVPILKYKYDDLNEAIKDIKEDLKLFYEKYITPKMFKYELLK